MGGTPTITVRGRAAKALWRRVRDSLHLLEGAKALPGLDGEDLYQAELRLCAFLQTMLYGEYWPRKRGYQSNHDYFLKLDRAHCERRGFLRLRRSREPLAVIIDGERGCPRVRLDMGYAEGLTTVIPLSRSGYNAFVRQTGPRFDHPVGPKVLTRYVATVAPDRQYRYLYVGTLFHLSRLNCLAKDPKDITIPDDFPDITVFANQLYRHLFSFTPKLIHTDYYPYIPGGGPLPILCCAAAGPTGRDLAAGTGFEELFQNHLGHARYRLDLGDLTVEGREVLDGRGESESPRIKAAIRALDSYSRVAKRETSLERDPP